MPNYQNTSTSITVQNEQKQYCPGNKDGQIRETKVKFCNEYVENVDVVIWQHHFPKARILGHGKDKFVQWKVLSERL